MKRLLLFSLAIILVAGIVLYATQTATATQVYYEDYNAQTTDNLPTNWDRNNATAFTPAVSETVAFEGTKSVKVKKELGSSTSAHWMAVDTTDPGTGDYEVEAVVYFATDDTTRGGVVFRGNSTGTNTGYVCALRAGTTFRMLEVAGETETVISTQTIGYDPDTHYHIKASANGDAIKCKFWADGSAEPGTWNIEATDATYDNTNHLVGAYFFNGSDDGDAVYFDALTINDFATDSCTYTSGDWNILGSDHCYITGDTYVTGACNLIGAGYMDLAGTISCSDIHGAAGFSVRGKNGTAKLYIR